jgi:hypothetical protein
MKTLADRILENADPAQELEAMIPSLERLFAKHFPKSVFNVRTTSGSGGDPMIQISFLLAKEYANGIEMNDPMRSIWFIRSVGPDSFTSELVVGGYVRTTNGRSRLGWANKKGTEAQLVNHFDKFLAKAKSYVTMPGIEIAYNPYA